jgi:hypothetical protein
VLRQPAQRLRNALRIVCPSALSLHCAPSWLRLHPVLCEAGG